MKLTSKKPKLHVVSAHGIGNSWNSLKWYEKLISKVFIGKTMKDHALQEEIAKTNPGGYYIIRPVGLTNEAPNQFQDVCEVVMAFLLPMLESKADTLKWSAPGPVSRSPG